MSAGVRRSWEYENKTGVRCGSDDTRPVDRRFGTVRLHRNRERRFCGSESDGDRRLVVSGARMSMAPAQSA